MMDLDGSAKYRNTQENSANTIADHGRRSTSINKGQGAKAHDAIGGREQSAKKNE